MLLLDSAALVSAAVAAVRTLDTLVADDVELLGEVHRLVGKAVELTGGSVPAVGSLGWWQAGPLPRLAGLPMLAGRADR